MKYAQKIEKSEAVNFRNSFTDTLITDFFLLLQKLCDIPTRREIGAFFSPFIIAFQQATQSLSQLHTK